MSGAGSEHVSLVLPPPSVPAPLPPCLTTPLAPPSTPSDPTTTTTTTSAAHHYLAPHSHSHSPSPSPSPSFSLLSNDAHLIELIEPPSQFRGSDDEWNEKAYISYPSEDYSSGNMPEHDASGSYQSSSYESPPPNRLRYPTGEQEFDSCEDRVQLLQWIRSNSSPLALSAANYQLYRRLMSHQQQQLQKSLGQVSETKSDTNNQPTAITYDEQYPVFCYPPPPPSSPLILPVNEGTTPTLLYYQPHQEQLSLPPVYPTPADLASLSSQSSPLYAPLGQHPHYSRHPSRNRYSSSSSSNGTYRYAAHPLGLSPHHHHHHHHLVPQSPFSMSSAAPVSMTSANYPGVKLKRKLHLNGVVTSGTTAVEITTPPPTPGTGGSGSNHTNTTVMETELSCQHNSIPPTIAGETSSLTGCVRGKPNGESTAKALETAVLDRTLAEVVEEQVKQEAQLRELKGYEAGAKYQAPLTGKLPVDGTVPVLLTAAGTIIPNNNKRSCSQWRMTLFVFYWIIWIVFLIGVVIIVAANARHSPSQ